jgi:hypothetical protein
MQGMSASPNNQNRVPKGVPSGGEFAEGRRGETQLHTLDQSYLDTTAKVLREQAFVPARRVIAKTGSPPTWWNNATVVGEYGGFARMDRSPKNIGSMRKTYKGKDFSLTMPSVTSVRRMGDQMNTDQPFDIPISTPRGDGTEELGWVRASRDKGGRWHVQALGDMKPEAREALSEGVRSMLEARRITGNLTDKDRSKLLADARERKKRHLRAGTAPVNSTWIDSLRYDHGNRAMVMTTDSGKTYAYQVPPKVYQQVATSYAPGKVINTHIKGKAAEAQVDQCHQCKRFYTTVGTHRCPAGKSRLLSQIRDQRRDAGMVMGKDPDRFRLLDAIPLISKRKPKTKRTRSS